MGRVPSAWCIGSGMQQLLEPELAPFANWLEFGEDNRDRFRWALRDSLDELLDGQRTGRWAYQHLSKTEKTYLGTAVEVNLTKEFEIANGMDLDWSVDGRDIDCKFSKDMGGWEIPMEMYLCSDHGDRQGQADQPALLTWMNDDSSEWAAGLITITDERLRRRAKLVDGRRVRAYNRDNKRQLSDTVAGEVYWLWGGRQTDLPRNHLLHLAPDARSRVFSFAKSGQKRVDQLFREVQGQLVGRRTILTVAQQDDAPKRVRDARIKLRPEGILILGHQESHPHAARGLGLPVPVKGEWVAVRVVPVSEADTRSFIELDGERWARAQPGEPVVAAPALPKR
ncbi:restriction endonuclease [Pseudactinotalea sp. HY158]|nr:restriction endonuclease [Pseudactinotalea sp. HY158]